MTIGAAGAAAQARSVSDSPTAHNPYKLIDMGTFGGPASYFSATGTGARVLNNQGTVAGYADTSTPDFYRPPACRNSACFMSARARRHDGGIRQLGSLPGRHSSAVAAIDRRRCTVGCSRLR